MNKAEQLKAVTEKLQKLSTIQDRTAAETSDMAQAVKESQLLRAELEAENELKASEEFLRTPATKQAHSLGIQPGDTQTIEVERGNPSVKIAESVLESLTAAFGEEQTASMSTKAYRDAYKVYLRKGLHSMDSGSLKDLQVGRDDLGGFLAPTQIQAQLIQKKPAPTKLAGLITDVPIGRDSVSIPRVPWTSDDIYTNSIRVTKTGEVPSSSTVHRATDPTFGMAKIEAFTHMVSIPLSKDLIEDSVFAIDTWVASKFEEAQNLIKESYINTGTGIGQPTGIFAAPGSTIAGQAQPAVVSIGSGFTTSLFQGVPMAIPEQYEDEELVWILNKTNTGKYIAQLQDSNNRPLFSYGYADMGLASARPRELLGYKFIYSAFAPDLTSGGAVVANSTPIAFGAPRAYYGVTRVGMTVDILREIKAQENQVLALGRFRWGGQTVEDWAIKVAKCA